MLQRHIPSWLLHENGLCKAGSTYEIGSGTLMHMCMQSLVVDLRCKMYTTGM